MTISFKDIHKSYGRVRANVGINLNLEPGHIYGLLGENGAGKSTLMRILAGYTQEDRGYILFDEHAVRRMRPAQALQLGIGMLHQDPLDFPALKTWENFLLGGGKKDRKETLRRLEGLAQRFHFHFSPHERAGELTVGERQQLEILRLVDLGVKVLILDEPTTGISLTQREMLFATMRELAKEKDRIIIFVTHKLAEATELCQEIFVMRQGRLVGHLIPPYHDDELLGLMFGSTEISPPQGRGKPSLQEEVFLRLEDATLAGEKYVLSGVSLTVHPGEIVGLAGLEGNGQELLLRSLAGLDRVVKGKLSVRGEELQGSPYLRFRQAGIHFMPAARLEEGLFPDLTLKEHILLAFPDQRARLSEFFLEECVKRFRLQAEPGTCARALSGGNQQRLLLALVPSQARLLLMEHPTRGLDVGSAWQVWEYLEERCWHGATLLFSSADLEEILAHSHRVLVFYNRKLTANLPTESIDLEVLGRLVAGQVEAA